MYIDFLILLIPIPVSTLFCSVILTFFFHFLNVFRSLYVYSIKLISKYIIIIIIIIIISLLLLLLLLSS